MCIASCALPSSSNSNSEHIHEFGEWSTIESATCTNAGVKVRYCTCGEKQSETIQALSHNVVIDEAFDATCVNTGLTEGKHCSVCNEILVAQTQIDAFGHTEDIDEFVAPTCSSTGLTAGKHCYVCNEILVAQTTIDALPHAEVIDAAVPPTCTAAGISEGKHCSVCNGTIIAQTIVDALGHTETVDTAVSSTCTATGLTEGKHCSVCNEVLVAQIETPKVNHSYDDEYDAVCNTCGFTRDAECAHTNVSIQPAKNATCTEPGLTEGKVCIDCEEVIVLQTVINALGHTEEILAAVAPTCTETGLTEGKKCSSCSLTIIAQSIVNATGHTPVIDPAVEPTATTTGLTEGSHCSVCHTVLVKQEIIDVIKEFSIYYVLSGGTLNTDLHSYNTDVGVSEEDMPIPTKDGYEFKGWYTTSYYAVESLVRDIPEGTKIDYRLYAKWELATYNVYFINAGKNIETISYNMNTQLVLNNPEWSGLIFTHWTDQNGKEYTPNGDLTFFPEKMTGNLTLTANWKSKQNLVTPVEGGAKLYSVYSGEDGFLYFFYELGTIENVVLESGDVYKKNNDVGDELTISKTETISKENAKSIANTVSKSISSTSSWEKTKNWSETYSENWNLSLGVEAEVGVPWFNVKLQETFGFGAEQGGTKGLTEAVGGSSTNGTTEENSVSSTFAYTEEISITKSHSYTISGDLPDGYYVYAYVGDVRVFAAVSYEIATGYLYLDTYSVLGDVSPTVMYYENVDQFNNMISNPDVEGLDFDIPEEEIVDKIENSYYIKYDANGGAGTMPTTMHTVGADEELPKNTFTKSGYEFVGWELDGVEELLKDGQSIYNLGNALETVTLKAIWKLKIYESDVDYIYFGEYPQTIKADDVIITSTQDSRGYYLGSDGFYYAKVTAVTGASTLTFSTGESVTRGTVYYFKVEPIRWRILSTDGETALILCDSIIANMPYAAYNNGNFTNKYEDSSARAWLNSTFYETAFADFQREIILTTTVDNSAYSTGYDPNSYACDDTEDKVFLLSYRDITNSEYGFSSNKREFDTARRMQTSDYSRATGVAVNYGSEVYYGNGAWLLRSPTEQESVYGISVLIIGSTGVLSLEGTNINSSGIVPAMWIKLNP